jgi:hypothetical protein
MPYFRPTALAGVLMVLCLTAGPLPAQHGEPAPLRTRGTIDAVTVYRGQAMVTRVIELDGDAALQRVVVESLPARVKPGSVYAESAGGLTVRSVRYRTRPVREDVREQVAQLDQQIKTHRREIEQLARQIDTLDAQQTLVSKLETFTAPAAEWELSHGVLDAEALQSITQFLFEQREHINEQRLELKFGKEDLEDNLNQLQRERNALTRTSSKTMREAVVFIESNGAAGQFELRYLVDNATWSPSYNLRGPASRDSVQLEYLASIRQVSGEDWNNVKMTLSTASPALVSEPPELASLSLSLSQPTPAANQQPQRPGQKAGAYSRQKAQLKQQQAELQARRNTAEAEAGEAQGGAMFDADRTAPTQSAAQGFDAKLNALGAREQLLDLMAGRAKRDNDEPSGQRRDGQQPSVRYELTGRASLPSRSDRQLVRITDQKLDAGYYRVARPVLSEQVYEQAALTNTMDWVLLAGPANSYLDGQFVGRGRVPGVSVGEKFKIGFGIDSALRTKRELLDRDATTQGGNRVVRITYRLSLANFADGPRTVRLFDRLPVPKRGEDVQVELVNTSEKPVKNPADADGQITASSDGVIRWDVEVPARATGDEQMHVDYTFTMEYDRQKRIDMNAESSP